MLPGLAVSEWSHEGIIARAREDAAFQSGLRAAAEVCRAQGRGDGPACPSGIAAVYIERLANGEMP